MKWTTAFIYLTHQAFDIRSCIIRYEIKIYLSRARCPTPSTPNTPTLDTRARARTHTHACIIPSEHHITIYEYFIFVLWIFVQNILFLIVVNRKCFGVPFTCFFKLMRLILVKLNCPVKDD